VSGRFGGTANVLDAFASRANTRYVSAAPHESPLAPPAQ
jgi:hypothetical protein